MPSLSEPRLSVPRVVDPVPADAALCAREHRLPGLGAVLASPALAAQAGLSGLQHAYLRYKPGTSCVAGLTPSDGSLDAWAAMTYPQARWEEICVRPGWTQGSVRARFVDEVYTVLVPLALERRLRNARVLATDDSRQRLLAALGLQGCTLRLLRYKPGRRIVLCADAATGPRAVVKLHADESVFVRALRGAAHAARHGGPSLLAASAESRAIAVAWAPGQTLHAESDPGDFALAGATLALLHTRSFDEELVPLSIATVNTTLDALGALKPSLDGTARRIVARLPDLPTGPAVALHGDFSADQVVIGSAGATLVDWDRATRGPVACDLGSALARLDLDHLLGRDTQAASDALLDGYAAVAALPAPSHITAYRAHALLALASTGFRERRAQWDEEMVAVLERVNTLCATAPRYSASRQIPSLAQATDAECMGPLLAATLPDAAGTDAFTTSVTRLKPGRRAMLRYTLSDGRTLLGKLRAKGPDNNTPRVQRRLRKAGLDGRDGVGVPAVAAILEKPAMWLQEALPGRSLADLLGDTGIDRIDVLRRTGRALAALHATPPQTDRRWSHTDELAVLGRAVATGPYTDLHAHAERLLRTLPPTTEVGLHRDFYVDQVLVCPATIWLVDLDLYACGDPAVDLGNFLAHLTELDLRHGRDPTQHAPLAAAFLEGYAEHRPLPSACRIDALHWVSLARHVSIAARFPERRRTIPTIAALCRDRLSRQLSAAHNDIRME